ncbi:zinc finger protein 809-like [Microplitis mediator]|uniref:zinc finger protein 809-like n=1 Tax=Microplitis mediator TaxID=375433 RepID=UPI002554C684|nr:zinc finger protein 809-like [Microplitis mediator]
MYKTNSDNINDAQVMIDSNLKPHDEVTVGDYFLEKEKIFLENSSISEKKNEVWSDDYISIIKEEGINLLKYYVKLNNSPMQLVLNLTNSLNFINNKILLEQNNNNFLANDPKSITGDLVFDKIKLEKDLNENGQTTSEVSCKESCENLIIKTEDDVTVQENLIIKNDLNESNSQEKKLQITDENSKHLEDIEILNRSISSMDLNSSDLFEISKDPPFNEPMNVVDSDLDSNNKEKSQVNLKKVTVPVTKIPVSSPVVLDSKISLEVTDDCNEQSNFVTTNENLLDATESKESVKKVYNKSTNLVELLKDAHKLKNINRDSVSKKSKRKANDDTYEISVRNDSRKRRKAEKSESNCNVGSLMGRTAQSSCFEKQGFVIPKSYQPFVRLNRIVLPKNDADSSAIESRNDKFETAETTNAYNLRRSGKNNNCKKCGKKFESPKLLKMHMKHHADSKPFKCRKCSYASEFKGNWSRHVKIHIKEEMVTKAQSRESKSRARSQTNEHEHKNDKSFTCNDCGELFNCKKLLTEHYNAYHNSGFKNNQYSCSMCSRTFRYYGRFSRHLRNFHGTGSLVQSKIN